MYIIIIIMCIVTPLLFLFFSLSLSLSLSHFPTITIITIIVYQYYSCMIEKNILIIISNKILNQINLIKQPTKTGGKCVFVCPCAKINK